VAFVGVGSGVFDAGKYSMPEEEIGGIVRLFAVLFYADDGYVIASTDAELLTIGRCTY